METLHEAVSTTTKYGMKEGAISFDFSMMELVRDKVLKDNDVVLYHVLVKVAEEAEGGFTYTARQAKEELGWGASKLKNSLSRLEAIGKIKSIGKERRTLVWLLTDLEEQSYYKETAVKATETTSVVQQPTKENFANAETPVETLEEPKTAIQEAKKDEPTFDEIFEQLQQSNPFTPQQTSENTPKETIQPNKEIPTNVSDDFFMIKQPKRNEEILSEFGYKPYEKKLKFNAFTTPVAEDGLPDLDKLCEGQPFITEEEWDELLK